MLSDGASEGIHGVRRVRKRKPRHVKHAGVLCRFPLREPALGDTAEGQPQRPHLQIHHHGHTEATIPHSCSKQNSTEGHCLLLSGLTETSLHCAAVWYISYRILPSLSSFTDVRPAVWSEVFPCVSRSLLLLHRHFSQ